MDPRRVWRVALAFALVAGAACAQEIRIVVQNSPLAGFRYHAASELWHELRVGDRLELEREPDNVHDANAVAVLWRGRKLGYVPRRDNGALAEHANPARRVRFEVYVE